MDNFLVDYLKSGTAWVLVGSGPSIDMGYPNWRQLAQTAAQAARVEGIGQNLARIESSLSQGDFPSVFEEASNILGGARLRQALQSILLPTTIVGKIYDLIAQWPVPVFLTTNYDDEIHNHLARLGEAYRSYSNSQDHFSYLAPGIRGAIFKLHGDLTSGTGLVLTSADYHDIQTSDSWTYWRTKLTSVFQFQHVVIVGHSLTDNNVKHVLEAAKNGAGVANPVCWIAPDVSPLDIKKYLEDYRIRVIPYDNQDGTHRNLFRLIENVTDFIPPRTSIHIQQQIAQVSQSPLGVNSAAPGFFIFNKLASQNDFEHKRIDILLAAIQATLSKLKDIGEFELATIFELAGWPTSFPLSRDLSQEVITKAIQLGLLKHANANGKLTIGDDAKTIAAENQSQFEHMRERFKSSLVLRLKRAYPDLTEPDVVEISGDIEASISGYFREGGLSLASLVFSSSTQPRVSPAPSSIIKFIRDASTKYSTLLKRQAFFTISVDAFVRSVSAERDYLGKIAQGFFAFHALGTFGDVAIQRLNNAKDTVWLVDSNAQILALALASPTNATFVDAFARVTNLGIRLFTTEKLFDETREHLWFANNVVKENGPDAPEVIAATTGQSPYRKSNEFLVGFVRWQEAGNPCDWESYLFHAFGDRNPQIEDVRTALGKLGIEIIPFQDWPGFSQNDFAECAECATRIKQLLSGAQEQSAEQRSLDDKIQPEAEAWLIVRKERHGEYCVISEHNHKSPAWFLSYTAVLNVVEEGLRVTWQPDAFLRFASTLVPATDSNAADRAFETILWQFAQTGLSLLDDNAIVSAFGRIIDQANIDMSEIVQQYQHTLSEKYGESLESVIARIPVSYRPLAAIQLANEVARIQTQKALAADAVKQQAIMRASAAEKELTVVNKYRSKAARWKSERELKKRKAKAKRKNKK